VVRPALSSTLPKTLKLLLGREQIARRMPELAREVHLALRNARRPIAVVVLQGAFIFAADLLRHLPPGLALEVAFLRCQSYGSSKRSSGRVMLLQDLEPELDLRGRTVLLIDDIYDSGLTMSFLTEHLRKRGAGTVVPCVLVRRRGTGCRAGGTQAVSLRHRVLAGFVVGKEFVVGYGLDLKGMFRHLPDLMEQKRRSRATVQSEPRA
jgi:hypoxanthine phosphoribosyltransferase